jgi:hypothetical protein
MDKNKVRQDLIDDWLNEESFAGALLFYELSAIERANKGEIFDKKEIERINREIEDLRKKPFS